MQKPLTRQPSQKGEPFMLRASLAFFVIGLLAVVLGANNVAGVSIELGKTLLFVFFVLAIISFVASLVSGRGGKSLP
jgi:uncharacterized membrane protein YtjA (UPF0391 family)